MGTESKGHKKDIKVTLSTLWIVVMFSILSADIFGFMIPGALKEIVDGDMAFKPTEGMLLAFAVFMEIPIVMIILSRVLRRKANRLVNIIGSVLTIAFVIAGGSNNLPYYFFAAVEVICMLLIIRTAWKWPKKEG